MTAGDGRVIVSTRVKRRQAPDRPGPSRRRPPRRGRVRTRGEHAHPQPPRRPEHDRGRRRLDAPARADARDAQRRAAHRPADRAAARLRRRGYAVAAARAAPRRAGCAATPPASPKPPPTPGCRCPTAHDEIYRLGETLNDMLDPHQRGRAAGARVRQPTPATSCARRSRSSKPRSTSRCTRSRRPSEWHYALVSAGEETDRLARLAEDLLHDRPRRGGRSRRRPRRAHRCASSPSGSPRASTRKSTSTIDPDLRVLAQPLALDRAADQPRSTTRCATARRTDRDHGRARGEWIELHVIDQGAGFADDYLPRAFERFSRPTGARTGGAGLGLSLVEAVAHTHGGEAGAANAPGGTDVWLTLPRAQPLLERLDPWSAVAGPVEMPVAGAPRAWLTLSRAE